MKQSRTRSNRRPALASSPTAASAEKTIPVEFPGPASPLARRLFAAALFLVLFIAYIPALNGGFIWDDEAHISDNGYLRSLLGLWQIWTVPGGTPQYYPLTFSVFWAGYHLWGLHTIGYHLLNVTLHGTAALLLWQVLERLKVRAAWLAAAIFALHPVCVMSVAWMTELKNTLSACLALGAAWAFVKATGLGVYEISKPSVGGAASRKASAQIPLHLPCYGLALFLFLLAMLSKTAVSFLPVSLLLATWWSGRRLNWRSVWPVVPMLAIVAGIGLMTIYIESHVGGAVGKQFQIPFLDRVLISGRSFWFYLGKLLFPHQLVFIYPRWTVSTGAWWQWLFPVAAIAALAGAWLFRRRIGRGPFAALLHFYVSTSFLGLILVLYMTRYSFVADHWQYFGAMSIAALFAAGITLVANQFGKTGIRAALAFSCLLLAGLGLLTSRQCAMYSDIETLWKVTLQRNPDCYMALNNYGAALLDRGDVDGAMVQFQKTVSLWPELTEGHFGLGNAFLKKHLPGQAIAEYRRAIEVDTNNYLAEINLGNVLDDQGHPEEAVVHYQAAIKIRQDNYTAYNDLGTVYMKLGRLSDGVASFQEALRIRPDLQAAENNLLRIAWELSTNPDPKQRNGAEAVKILTPLVNLSSGSKAEVLYTLGAAYAEDGRYAEAVSTARQALRLADAQSNAPLAESLRVELNLYQSGRPFHEDAPK